ncbi:MAG: hypothetical protein H7267_08950, partial [Sandarakinorhabdus sp.]|nr:hypothetical protein [Sandarakinorhabdus sp.]
MQRNVVKSLRSASLAALLLSQGAHGQEGPATITALQERITQLQRQIEEQRVLID